jgi:hypothetical protein
MCQWLTPDRKDHGSKLAQSKIVFDTPFQWKKAEHSSTHLSSQL